MSTLVIILIVCLAVVIVLWLMFGINWRSNRNYEWKHHLLQAKMQAEDSEELQRLLFSGSLTMCVEQRFRPLAMLLSQNRRPSVSTSETEIIISGRRKYDLLIRDLINARESIHMEYFHFGIDKSSRRIRRLLMRKAQQGVKVRFINENIANFPIPSIYFLSMRRAGVEVVNFSNTRFSLLRFLMTLSYRDHRKIVVIDNRIGYTGGMNINDHYFYQWRDTHLRLTGEAVVSLQYAFLDTWLAAGGRLQDSINSFFHLSDDPFCGSYKGTLTQITPDDPTSPEPVLQTAYEWILNHAQHYVWIQSPYLAPPDSLMQAFRNAVKRGVEVAVMVPERCDTGVVRPINRSFYHDFVQAGVKLYVRTGEFNHSKTIVADDYLTMIGTTNLDNRSFGIDYEIDTFFYDEPMALHNKAIFEKELQQCRLLNKEELDNDSWLNKLFCRTMRVLAPII